jgi:hypothetical protein
MMAPLPWLSAAAMAALLLSVAHDVKMTSIE